MAYSGGRKMGGLGRGGVAERGGEGGGCICISAVALLSLADL